MANIQEIQANEEARRVKWERETVGMRDADGKQWTIAELRAAFDRHHTAADWKTPVCVRLDMRVDDIVRFCRAVEFFQGDRPDVRNAGGSASVLVTSRGYQG